MNGGGGVTIRAVHRASAGGPEGHEAVLPPGKRKAAGAARPRSPAGRIGRPTHVRRHAAKAGTLCTRPAPTRFASGDHHGTKSRR